MTSLINSFLARYTHLKPYGEDIKNYLVEELQNRGITLSKENIQYRKGYVFIDTSPLVKTRLLTDKRALIETVNTKLRNSLIIDIH